MTWYRKLQGVAPALVMFGFFAILFATDWIDSATDWIDSFSG